MTSILKGLLIVCISSIPFLSSGQNSLKGKTESPQNNSREIIVSNAILPIVYSGSIKVKLEVPKNLRDQIQLTYKAKATDITNSTITIKCNGVDIIDLQGEKAFQVAVLLSKLGPKVWTSIKTISVSYNDAEGESKDPYKRALFIQYFSNLVLKNMIEEGKFEDSWADMEVSKEELLQKIESGIILVQLLMDYHQITSIQLPLEQVTWTLKLGDIRYF